METLQRTANRGSISTGYDIDNSLKFEADNTEYLSHTSSGSSGTKLTFSFWTKRTELDSSGSNYMLPAGVIKAGESVNFYFNADKIRVDAGNGGNGYRIITNSVYRDTASWYHMFVVIDTTLSTSSDRIQLWVNGVRQTDLGTDNQPTQNFSTGVDVNNAIWRYGAYDDTYYHYSGYIAEAHKLDGIAASCTDFGEFDEDSAIWIPKKYSGSYGTNGHYLKFADSSSLGTDSSGNGNDFTLNNIAAADQATDTPTNNFCTWSPLWSEPRANGTISEGATQVAWGGGAWKIARSSMAVSKGRWYWEIKGANVTGDTWNNNLFGFASVEGEDGQYGPSVLIGYSTGNYYYRVADSQTGDDSTGWDSGGAWSSSDTFGFALDLESSTKKFILYRNGSAVNGSGTDLVSAFQTEQFFTPYASSYNGDTQFWNWGGYTVNTISSAASDANGYGTFEYAPPSGYYSICTKNLAEYG